MAHAPVSIRGKVKFGPFLADLRTAELRKHDLPVKLAGRPFAILALLLEAEGEIVTREELRARLWPPDTFVDFENNINTAVGKLRSALGDSAAVPRYIETAGRGYRFLADIEWLLPEPPAQNTPEPAAPAAQPLTQSKVQWWFMAAAAAVAVIALWWFAYPRRSRPAAPPSNARIAVLPFQNLTGDDSEEYLSDGLTEEIIAQLGALQIRNLSVIANASVMHYKHADSPLDQVGQDLGAQYVVEGGVRREGDRVRVNAELIEMEHKTQVWARQYDREQTGLLALQTEIARQIAGEVHSTFAAKGHRSGATSPENYPSYDSYLKGQYFFRQRTAGSLIQAIGYFSRAIQQDPYNARAYAGLADCYALLPGYSGTVQAETLKKARESATKAVELDPALPEAHAALGLAAENSDWDWATAEQEFRQAIALNPSYATAHHWYAENLAFRGRFDEALRESQIARQLDPLSLIVTSDEGAILYYARRYDEAVARWQSVLAMDPNFSRAQLIIFAYTAQGREAEALKHLASRSRTLGDEVWHTAAVAYVAGHGGDRVRARRALEQLLLMYRKQPFDPRILARAYLAVGDKDHALAYLEKACDRHSIELSSLYVNPEFDSIRSEPRFQRLLARVHLP